MYQIGDYVVKINNGICKVEDIMNLDMPSVDKNRLYYLLIPQDENRTKFYVPTDRESTDIRKVMSEEEAWYIIRKIPQIEEAWITDEKQREQKYKEAIRSGEPEALVSIIKNMYMRRQRRDAQGKKSTSTDERYFKLAEDYLYSELAFALGKRKEEMQQLIVDSVNGKNE